MAGAARRRIAAGIAMLASTAILVTLMAHYVDHVIVNPNSFADRATSVLRTSSVDSLVVERVTDDVIPPSSAGAQARPTIQAAVFEALSSQPVIAEFRSAAEALHTGLLSGTAERLTLSLPDVGAAIAPSIESQSPTLASEVRDIGTVTILDVQIPPTAATAIHDTTHVSDDSTRLLLLSVVLTVLALAVSPYRRRTLIGLGLRAFASGLLVAATYFIGREVLVSEFSGPDARIAARAVWTTYLRGLETQGLVLTGVGALLAAAARFI